MMTLASLAFRIYSYCRAGSCRINPVYDSILNEFFRVTYLVEFGP